MCGTDPRDLDAQGSSSSRFATQAVSASARECHIADTLFLLEVAHSTVGGKDSMAEAGISLEGVWVKRAIKKPTSKNWKTRFFKLEGPHLSYFKNEKAKRPRGIVTVTATSKVRELSYGMPKTGFELTTPDKTLYAYPTVPSDLKTWIDGLDTLIESLKPESERKPAPAPAAPVSLPPGWSPQSNSWAQTLANKFPDAKQDTGGSKAPSAPKVPGEPASDEAEEPAEGDFKGFMALVRRAKGTKRIQSLLLQKWCDSSSLLTHVAC